MKSLLPLLFFLTCLSCNENDLSQTKRDDSKPLKEGNQLVVKRDSLDYTQQYDLPNSEGQQTQPAGTPGKRKLYNCVFFLCTVKEVNNVTVYYTQNYNLEKSGFVEMQLSLNRLKDCIEKEIIRTYRQQGVSVESVEIGEQIFQSQKEAEDWYFRYIKNTKTYPYNSECTDL